MRRTFCELAAVKLASLQFDGDDMSEGLMEKFDGDTEACCSHFCVREGNRRFVQRS